MAKRCCRIYDFLIIDATAPFFYVLAAALHFLHAHDIMVAQSAIRSGVIASSFCAWVPPQK